MGVLLLCVRPIDQTKIVVLCWSFSAFFACFAFLAFLLCAAALETNQPKALPAWVGFSWLVLYGLLEMALLPTLLWCPSKRCQSHKRSGLLFNLPPRLKLLRLWATFRLWILGNGVVFLFMARPGGVEELVGPWERRHNMAPLRIGFVVSAIAFLLGTLASGHKGRGRVYSWVSSLGKGASQLQEAAAIAALCPRGRAVASSMFHAAESFLALPLASLTAADLASNEDTRLNERVHRAALGEVDAFVSHSWRDDGDRKFAKLVVQPEARVHDKR